MIRINSWIFDFQEHRGKSPKCFHSCCRFSISLQKSVSIYIKYIKSMVQLKQGTLFLFWTSFRWIFSLLHLSLRYLDSVLSPWLLSAHFGSRTSLKTSGLTRNALWAPSDKEPPCTCVVWCQRNSLEMANQMELHDSYLLPLQRARAADLELAWSAGKWGKPGFFSEFSGAGGDISKGP